MILKVIGLALTIGSCGGMGFKIAATYMKEIRVLKKLIDSLDMMECELQYRLTPLPELCAMVAADNNGVFATTFAQLETALKEQLSPNVDLCMSQVIQGIEGMPASAAGVLRQLGKSLGRFDVDGQLKGLAAAKQECRLILEQLSANQQERVRSFKTLGICAGAAIAILLI